MYVPTLPLWGPFVPNFMDYFSQAAGTYEGIPLIPPLYASTMKKKNFMNIQFLILIIIGTFLVLFSPLCILAYGHSLREIVLLNLDFGTFETLI